LSFGRGHTVGNLGDVFKHFVLLELLPTVVQEKAAKRSKDFTFGYVETHCQAPEVSLSEGGLWEKGIGQLVNKYIGNGEDIRDSSNMKYLFYTLDEVFRNKVYPSSWCLVRNRLKDLGLRNFNFTLYSPSAEVAQVMKVFLQDLEHSNIEYFCKDGLVHFKDNLRRVDFVFLDPDYTPLKGDNLNKSVIDALKAGKYLRSRGISFILAVPYYSDKQWGKVLSELSVASFLFKPTDVSALPDNVKGVGLLVGGIDPFHLPLCHASLQRAFGNLGSFEFALEESK